WWLGSFGISVPASMPGWAVIAPIPGLLFYAMLATTLGLLFKTEMFALVGSIIFVIVERVVANVFRPPTVLPGMLQDAAVRSTIRESTMEWWVAALILLGLAGAILAAIQWWF